MGLNPYENNIARLILEDRKRIMSRHELRLVLKNFEGISLSELPSLKEISAGSLADLIRKHNPAAKVDFLYNENRMCDSEEVEFMYKYVYREHFPFAPDVFKPCTAGELVTFLCSEDSGNIY